MHRELPERLHLAPPARGERGEPAVALPELQRADPMPEIVEAVGGKAKIIVDGGIRSGYDIFRALALGADAVMICRPVLVSYYGGGEEGIRVYIRKLKDEFSDAMYMCGARKVDDIDKSMLRLSK